MSRAGFISNLVRSGLKGDQAEFRKDVEVLIAAERAKKHNNIADHLAAHLAKSGNFPRGISRLPITGVRNGQDADLYHEIEPRRRLHELILPQEVDAACKELIEEQNREELLCSHGIEPRHRVLLTGSPGNGKTSLAEAMAAELSVPLLVVRYEGLIGSFLGETAVRLAKLFEQAQSRRCVLFLDEFDVVGKERGDVHETGEIKRVVSSLLLQIDALPSYVVVITATNHPELLDRAVWRRFQLRLRLPPPTQPQIEDWFRRFDDRLGVSLEHSHSTLANKLNGISFSELEQFSLDVHRSYILSLPGCSSDIRSIVNDRLAQWEKRSLDGIQTGI